MTYIVRLAARTLIGMSIFAGTIVAQPRIDLTDGTLFIAGSFAFKYKLTDFEQPQHKLMLETDVGGGYFILDRFAIGLGVPGEWTFAPASGGALGLKIFSTYFFEIDSIVFPYLGANTTPGYSMNEKEFQLKAGLDSGVLISLSESVAVDFGIRPELSFKIYDSQKWKFSLPAGFIGIKAVF
jgi:hypothetical protein